MRLILLWPLLAIAGVVAETPPAPERLLLELDAFPHARRVDMSRESVVDYEVGLGAMQKHLGDWQFKNSRRLDGERLRYSWQIVDGFSSREIFEGLVGEVGQLPGSELLFACEGRACGNGAQWANRVFGQRVLYGRADEQRYRIYRVGGEHYLLAYASARTSDRQYLHAELVTLAEGAASD
ncbi:DUF4892 domain-containing protein [Parahaliea mediterranea]|nr:DUF4892 domain-containing protein [Parahaliea mediterranea]